MAGPAVRLAWCNIAHNRVRFAATVVGVAFAVLLVIFQGSLLFGFLDAAGRLVESADADLWITARGVACFDFPSALPHGIVELCRGVPGIDHTSLVATGFAEYQRPDGRQQLVALVGADAGTGSGFPVPYVAGSRTAVEPEAVLVDRSNAELLNAAALPMDVEINRRRAQVVGEVSGFSSFLGCPYVFTSYESARKYLNLASDQAVYVLAQCRRGISVTAVQHALQRRLPEVDVWTRDEFARRSRGYWMTQTGAGGGILTAAVLGFLIGLVIVSQNIYATTMENLEEFATLKALGASRQFVIRVVLGQCLALGAIGSVVGLLLSAPLVRSAQNLIPWVRTPAWLPLAAVPLCLLMCALAGIVSVRAVLSVEPARVFRA